MGWEIYSDKIKEAYSKEYELTASPVERGVSLPLSDIELKAEIFKVIRANESRPKKIILEKIKGHLPELSIDKLQEILLDLAS